MADRLTVAIVPHTHWDREWYEPFQTLRLRLVQVLDGLLALLERDLGYARFLLDGQTQVIDDYLEVRPEARAALSRLAASGRLSVGPWMILMDEYMVSGETIVRDLQMGLRRATELGGAMPVGYLPDMFGHVAQMPQILRLAGIAHAVVWRGVPSAIGSTAFWWEAPDGSGVRAEYLWGSYGNGQDLPDDAKRLVARVQAHVAELGDRLLPGSALLLMNGFDHEPPQPWLGRVVAEANAIQDDYRFVITSLPELLATQPSEGLATWRGELRSGARANVLMGVASNRVDVHQTGAAAERALEKRAEPASALLLDADAYPHHLLELAWRLLVLNSAHDSSCACSHDEVVDAVLVRYREARQIGDGLTRAAVRALAGVVDAPAGSTVVVNTTASTRDGLVTLPAPGDGYFHLEALDDGTVHPAQVLRRASPAPFTAEGAGQDLAWLVESVRGVEAAGLRIGRHEVERAGDGAVEVCIQGAGPDEAAVDVDELREELVRLMAAGTRLRIRIEAPSRQEVVACAGGVPGFGWRTYRVMPGEVPGPVRAGDGWLANERLRVTIDPVDVTFGVETSDGLALGGLGRLVDGGDGGDTYNYSPPPQDVLVDRPAAVAVRALETGPVRARIALDAEYDWPTHALGDARACHARSASVARVAVTTTLTLQAGEPFVRVHIELDNRCRDHRVRAHFPLPTPVDRSHAECAFAVVERGLAAEGGPHELGLPTYVSRRFVDCSDGTVGLAVLHDGLLEYEVVEHGRELALTLLRATGYLSRLAIPMRPSPAGPPDPLEGPQLQRRLAFDYAVLPHRGDWTTAALSEAADAFLVPLERARAGGGAGTRPPSGQRLRVDGAIVSAVRREPGGLVVRAYNPRPDVSSIAIDVDGAPSRGWVIDLRGQPVERFEGARVLRAGEIVTLRLA